jgi:hypothetical protein
VWALVKIGLFTDQRTVLAAFDSDTAGLTDPEFPGQLFGFDYANFSYYFEVELIKSAPTGNPGVKHVGIFHEEG